MKKFYEFIDLDDLYHRGKMLGFNETVLRVCINMYKRSRRYLALGGAYYNGGFARLGLPAGCVYATFFVKVYVVTTF